MLLLRGQAAELRTVVRRRHLPGVVVAGVAAGGYQLAFFTAVAATGVAVGTVVALGVAPVATGLCATVALREPLTRRWVLATTLAVLGCTTLVLGGASDAPLIAAVSFRGVVLAVVAGACYAVYTTAAKSLLNDGLAPLAVLTATLGLGASVSLPVLVASGRALLVPRAVPVLLWLCLVTTALAYVLFVAGLRRLPAGHVGTPQPC